MPFKIAFEIKLFSFIFDGSLPFSATFKVFQWHRQWSQRQCDNSAFMHSLDHLMILACIFFFLPFFQCQSHIFFCFIFSMYITFIFIVPFTTTAFGLFHLRRSSSIGTDIRDEVGRRRINKQPHVPFCCVRMRMTLFGFDCQPFLFSTTERKIKKGNVDFMNMFCT